VLVIVSDTHGTDDHRLTGQTKEAVETAEVVLHAGDFTTEAVLDAFQAVTAGEFVGVYGNNDEQGVVDRLDAVRVIEWAEKRIVLVHGHGHDETALDLLGRQEGADLVVVGHTHQPEIDRTGAVPTVYSGSHADPRRYRPAHVELVSASDGVAGRLVRPDGEAFGEFDLSASGCR